MKTISAGMQTHLEQALTTLTFTVKLVRPFDGLEVFASTFNRALTIDGDVYEPFGFGRTDLDSDDAMSVGTCELTGILDSDTITEADLVAGLWDFATWEAKYYNWGDLTMTPVHQGSGTLGVVRTGRLKFVAEVLGLMQAAQVSILNLTSPTCIHDFGDNNASPSTGNGCTFDVSTVTFAGTIAAVDANLYTITDAARTEPEGYFTNGKFRIMTGTWAGLEREVRAYDVGEWILFTSLPADLTGEDYEIVKGCDKSLRMCVDEYDNILDRLASDYTQGNDAAFSVATKDG